MSASITRSSDDTIVSPDLVMPHEDHEDTPQSIVHTVIGSEYPDITLRPAAAPTGSMRLFFADFTAANSARQFHRAAATFAVNAPDMPWLPAAYVPTRIGRAQQLEDRGKWIVEIGYQEIDPESGPVPATLVIIDGIVQAAS